MSLARRALTTEAEFLALPETTERVELIDGEIHVSPSPSPTHQTLLSRIVFELTVWSRTREVPPYVGQAPFDIRFGPNRILQPGAFVVLGGIEVRDPGPLTRIPEICVEVISSNRMHDRVTKRFVYAAAGVQELWIVEPVGLVEVYAGPGLENSTEFTDTLTSPLLPGFSLDLTELFRL